MRRVTRLSVGVLCVILCAAALLTLMIAPHESAPPTDPMRAIGALP